MTEREMEDLLWNHPEKFMNEPLRQFQRQPSSVVGRADVIFEDRIGRLLVVEIKRDTLERGAVAQLIDYYGALKTQYPEKAVELMVVAARIPRERRLACEQYDITALEIPHKRFRDVAAEVGYEFKSERGERAMAAVTSSPGGDHREIEQHGAGHFIVPSAQDFRTPSKIERAWLFWSNGRTRYFIAFVNARGSCSLRRFDAADGRAVEKKVHSGDYQVAFADYLRAGKPVHVSRQPNLENKCKYQLPSDVLAELSRQVGL